jgi:hypothetical protein
MTEQPKILVTFFNFYEERMKSGPYFYTLNVSLTKLQTETQSKA